MSEIKSSDANQREATSRNNVDVPYFFDTRPNVRTTFFRLFMYVSEDSLFKILKSGLLRLSLPWNTNDVTECVARQATTQSEGVKEFGYLCFSANPHSPAMWGLYADRSKGACLAFDFEVQSDEDDSSGRYDILDKGAFFYSRDVIRRIEYSEDRLPAVSKQDERFDTSFFFRKSREWEHEKEYRILYRLAQNDTVTIDREEGSPVPRFYVRGMLSHLSAIMLGTRFPYQIEEVKALMREYENESELNQLGDSEKKVRVMKVNFDDKTFAFNSDIAFNPDIRTTLNEARLEYFLNSSWKLARGENGYSFTGLTGDDYRLDSVYCLRYNEDEEYYLARKKSEDSELELSLFRLRKDGEIGVISVVHPGLLAEIYKKAMADAFANKVIPQPTTFTISPEHAEQIRSMVNK